MQTATTRNLKWLYLDIIGFKTKNVTLEKEGHS